MSEPGRMRSMAVKKIATIQILTTNSAEGEIAGYFPTREYVAAFLSGNKNSNFREIDTEAWFYVT